MTALDAMADELGIYQREIDSLKRQRAGLLEKIAVLQLQKTEAEIRLQTQLLQVHADYLDRLTALEAAQNRTANIVQGLPTRDEFTLLKNDYYAHSANS